MRRITLKYARPGMVLGAPVYDDYGTMLLDAYIRLDKECLKALLDQGVAEILLDDWRVADVVVQPIVSPELEGKAAQALRRLMIENQGKGSVAASNLDDIIRAASAMARELAVEGVGEASIAGIFSQENYMYIQPVKAAVLSLLLGRRLGYGQPDLATLGAAALLKDIGYISIPQEILHRPDLLTEKELVKIRQHPMFGYELLSQHHSTSGAIASAVLQHHERWSGTGYPYGLKGTDINRHAQIIALADTHTALLSKRPGRKMYMPHEAIEYIMAYSGEQFNPELVELFVRQVPCYSSGLTVKLNTKEIGIVSNANLGFIGRPTVRVIYDENQGRVNKPYDLDLSKIDYQHKLIIEIMDYF
jgi:HD-GYP domain-containing protein (c-di-GMP phosphodiesterase class II)